MKRFWANLLASAFTLLVAITAASAVMAETAPPGGAKNVMRSWTDKGILWLNCVHPSCVEGSIVSMRPMEARLAPSPADFQREQMAIAGEGLGRIATRGGSSQFGAPMVRKSRGATTMQLRGQIQEPGQPVTFITRGMIYCDSCTVSVVSSSTSKSRADAMFGYGYNFCKKDRKT